MIVKEKNQGAKIPYEVSGRKITIDDDLTINLAKRQSDSESHIDICYDEGGELVIGAAAGRAYVAEIEIPAREYQDTKDLNGETAPVPLDMEKVTLTLWAVE